MPTGIYRREKRWIWQKTKNRLSETCKFGRDIGKKPPGHLFHLISCPDCGLERWRLSYATKNQPLCHKCSNKRRNFSGEHNPRWKGGRTVAGGKSRYIRTMIFPEFFLPMASKDGYILEHRLVMSQHLGRCLHSWEIVHHKNNDTKDNRIDNLYLANDAGHNQITYFEKILKAQAEKIRSLEKRLKLFSEKYGQEVELI